MDKPLILDEELCKRLPLPLAQLYRRAHTAKSELEQYHVAYYLWEASLKLLASVVIIEAANQDPWREEDALLLQKLTRPETADWCQILRQLLPRTAPSDASLHRTCALFTCSIQDELPRCAELECVLRELQQDDQAPQAKGTLFDLFPRLAAYREAVFGTALVASRSSAFYHRLGQALLAATEEWLARIDVLAGQELVFVSDVTEHGTGRWLLQRYALTGDIAHRMRPLELSGSVQNLPRSGNVYLDASLDTVEISDTDSLRNLRSLHPLLLFDVGLDQVFFLNSRSEGDTEYLCYTTGQVRDPQPLAADLRQRLSQLLHAPLESLSTDEWAPPLRQPAPFPNQTTRPLSAPTTGEFTLLTCMGQGGMGVVYRAWQASLGRQVAVKSLIRGGDRKAQARFSREIHALARVEHPHLVKIFSSGVDGDRWYYAMELIEGVDLGSVSERLKQRQVPVASLGYGKWDETLQLACREARLVEKPLDDQFQVSQLVEQPGAERPAPTVAGAAGYIQHMVRLILQVTQATRALHEAGVVHRDIKPGNVMVTSNGQHAVLMDLGLAQLADEGQRNVTQTRQFIGTLRYASPEQVLAAGRVDQRSDVYSLGATLWELLTLQPLFGVGNESSALELMHRIEYSDPESIRKYNPAVPKDLDAIVCKCLEKSPERRYPTAADLAEEWTRFLNHEPVQARPISRPARLARHVRRHPIGSGLTLACATTLIVLIALAINIWNLRRERQFTVQLQQANQRADQSFRQAVQALDGIFTLVTEGELRKRPDLQPLRTQLLDYYQGYVRQFGQGQELDTDLAAELARTFGRMAKITNELGTKQDALKHYDSAIHVYQDLLARESPRSDHRDALSQVRIDRGLLLQETRAYDEAESDFVKARDMLSELCEDDPHNYPCRRHLAEAYHNLGILYEAENRYTQSLESYERGRQIREQLVSESEEREFKRDLGRSYGYLGDVQIAMGDYRNALRSYRRSVDIRQQVADSQPSDHEARFQLARGFRNLGYLRQLENDLEKAIEWYTKATDEERRLVDEEPLIRDYRQDLGSYSNDLVELLIDQGTLTGDQEYFSRARKHVSEALTINQELTRRHPRDMPSISALARTYVNLARLALLEGTDGGDESLSRSRQYFARLTNPSADDDYQQAVLEALTAQRIAAETTPMTSDRIQQRDSHLNLALRFLSQATVKSRYTVLPRLSRDSAFEAMKNRPDFQLVSSIGFEGLDASTSRPRGDRRLTVDGPRLAYKHLYVLTVGVADYKDPAQSLEFPDDDARDLAAALRQQPVFESVTVKTLTNQQADRITILNALKQLRLQALHPCLLVVALSGHGRLHESGDYYFLPYDFDFDPQASLAATGISWDDLLREFQQVPGSVVILLDTCHSGAATQVGLRGPRSDAMESSVRRAASEISAVDDKGVVVLASSLSRQSAQERPDWGHGALSLAVLEALATRHLVPTRSATQLPIPSSNQLLSLEQVRNYAVERVNELTDGQQKVIAHSTNLALIDIPLSVHAPSEVSAPSDRLSVRKHPQ